LSEEMYRKKRVLDLGKKEGEERAVFEGVDSGRVIFVSPESV
jgi:hypothetical protein